MFEEEFPTSIGAYMLVEKIGHGEYAIWKARCLSNGKEIAVKIIDLDRITVGFDNILVTFGFINNFAIADDV